MDFSYEIDSKDNSIDLVRSDEKFYNYSETNLHKFDETYEELYHYILDNDDIVFDYLYPKSNFDRKYILNSINIWKELGITLQNINIFKLFRTGNKMVVYNFGVFDSFKERDPSYLKIKFKNILKWDSKVELKEIDEEDYKNIAFNRIILPKLDKELCSTIYAHELTHTQLMKNNGGTNSIFYEETLPILMEFIFAEKQENSLNNLKYVNNERLMSMCKSIDWLSKGNLLNYSNRVTIEKYIISGLQAIELFKIYYSNEKIKKEMLNDINNIFCGKLITEDMINKYEVDYNDVAKKKELKLF